MYVWLRQGRISVWLRQGRITVWLRQGRISVWLRQGRISVWLRQGGISVWLRQGPPDHEGETEADNHANDDDVTTLAHINLVDEVVDNWKSCHYVIQALLERLENKDNSCL